jgi:glycolate oxidase
MSGANALLQELEQAAGLDAVATAEGDRSAFAADESSAEPVQPDVVVRPPDTAAVARVLAVADRRRVPVVPVGGRTGLAGGSVPLHGGVSLSLERLDHIAPVDRGNFTVSVGAGARTAEVQRAALTDGLFYPPDPASLSRSTIGGNIAANAGGPRCFKYGVTADYVLSLEAVAADGRVFRTGRPTRKSTAGLRLAALLVGSEGTLAVVTEATLRLVAAPGARAAATATFASLEAAGRAVVAIVQGGVVPSALELLDRDCAELLGLEGEALLLVEVDGADERSVEAALGRLAPLLGRDADVAHDEAGVERLWSLRRGLSPALAASAPDYLFEDVCVPVSRIPEALHGVEEIARRRRLRIPVFCHAGDGNLHPSILFDRRAADEPERARAAEADVMRLALSLGGTISAEHGVGLLKLPWLAEELDPAALDQMRAIKRALDPHGILNPGKALPG